MIVDKEVSCFIKLFIALFIDLWFTLISISVLGINNSSSLLQLIIKSSSTGLTPYLSDKMMVINNSDEYSS